MKKLISSSSVVYDYLTEKKGLFLDSLKHKSVTKAYLNGLLKNEIWAPEKTKSENWKN